MADFEIMVTVIGGDVEPAKVVDEVLSEAARLALDELRATWPVRTGRSRDGLRADGPAVVGSAPYTDDVRRSRGEPTIASSEAPAIGERAAERAASKGDIDASMDGAIAGILRDSLET